MATMIQNASIATLDPIRLGMFSGGDPELELFWRYPVGNGTIGIGTGQ